MAFDPTTAKLENAPKGFDPSSAKLAEDAPKQDNSAEGFLAGERDPLEGATQLLYNALPQSVDDAISSANNWLRSKGVPLAEMKAGGINTYEKEREEGLKKDGISSTDRLAGNILNPANAIGLGELNLVTKSPMLIGAAAGAGQAALAPHGEDGDYWTNELKGSLEGGIVGGTLGKAGQYAHSLVAPYFSKDAADVAAKAKDAKSYNKAASRVEARAGLDKLTPEEIRAKQAAPGSPVLADMGDNLTNMAGRVRRSGTQASSDIEQFAEHRNRTNNEALAGSVESLKGDWSKNELEQLFKEHDAAGAPHYEAAFQPANAQPLDVQAQFHLDKSGRDIEEHAQTVGRLQRQLQEAENRRFTTAGKTPDSSSEDEIRRQLGKAQNALSEAQDSQARAHAFLSRSDKEKDLPGAVWSPHIERMLERPKVTSGVRQGVNRELDRAAAQNRPAHTNELAITGYGEDGQPIIAKVPTMRSLAAAKDHLRGLASDQVHPLGHPRQGRMTADGLATEELHNALRDSLYAASPQYEKASKLWSDATSLREASRKGSHHFDFRGTDAERQAEFEKLTPVEKKAYRVSAVDQLLDRFKKTDLKSDRTRSVNRTEADINAMRMMFDSPEEASTFFQDAASKQRQHETYKAVRGKVSEPEEAGAHETRKRVWNITSGLTHALHGSPWALRHIAEALADLPARDKEEVQTYIGKILTDPNFVDFARRQAPKVDSSGINPAVGLAAGGIGQSLAR